jgi:hypothetical protein
MSNEFKDLERGDVVWFVLNEGDLADTAEVEEITSSQVTLRWSHGLLVADAKKFHLLEKWWGHGPLGDGTGMGPDGFDINLCSEEDIDQFPWLKKSNDIKDLEKEK